MSRRLMCWTSARIQKNTSFFTAVVTIYCRLPRSEIGVLSSYTRCLPLPKSTDGKKEKYLFAVGWTPGSCHRRCCRTFVSIMFWNKICFYRSCFFPVWKQTNSSPRPLCVTGHHSESFGVLNALSNRVFQVWCAGSDNSFPWDHYLLKSDFYVILFVCPAPNNIVCDHY